jgi:endonuclease/exonuclease/phosphatase family metal-dependent hydrolase
MFSLVAQAHDLSVLTWNTFLLPPPINNTKQVERGGLIAEKLRNLDHDIVFFQETFYESERELIIKDLASTYPFIVLPKKGDGIFQFLDSGLMIASKYPVKILDQVVFEDCVFSDCFASKSAIIIEVTLPDNKKIQMLNTHLQAWNEPKAVAVRKRQLLQIKTMMKANAEIGTAQILVGDLNIDGKDDPEYGEALALMEMSSTSLEGILNISNGFETAECYDNPGGRPEWIDHMWLNPNGTDTEIRSKKVVPIFGQLGTMSCPLSDHYAVEAKVLVRQSTQKDLAKSHNLKGKKSTNWF